VTITQTPLRISFAGDGAVWFWRRELACIADVTVVVPSDHYGVMEAVITAVCHDLAKRLL